MRPHLTNGMGGFRRSGIFGGTGSLGPSAHMGQAPQETTPIGIPTQPSATGDWYPRAKRAAEAWDALIERVAAVDSDSAQDSLVAWMGRSDAPGSNAERYMLVTRDMETPVSVDPAIALRRVEQLEGAVEGLQPLVEAAEEKYGVIGGESPSGAFPWGPVFLGALVIGGMIAIPFWLKD